MSASTKKTVGIDDITKAIAIRESGGSWQEVIRVTGFNGATLRPHITEWLQRERLHRPATTKGDRVDSPYAIVQSVTLDTESIDKARLAGMAWYSIAKALGVSEAKVKGLASPEAKGRVYAKAAKTSATTEPATTEAKPAPKAKAPAKARRAAKPAPKAKTA